MQKVLNRYDCGLSPFGGGAGEVSYNTPPLPQTPFTLNYESTPLRLSFRFNISLTPPKYLFLNV